VEEPEPTEYVPSWQRLQKPELRAPVELENVPAMQGVQFDATVAPAWDPAEHDVHAEAPTVVK